MKLVLQAGLLLFVTTLITGVLYPALITGIGQLVWKDKCNGSLVKKGDAIIGSALIAQSFKRQEYFWPRPSASDFNALPSSASNLGPTSADLATLIAKRRHDLAAAHNVRGEDIPPDLLTASGSGLDPHISPESAYLQVNRIMKARGLALADHAKIHNLIDQQLEHPQFQIFGEPRINVLLLNLALDQCCSAKPSS